MKKIAFFLHMSEKSSTFAPDFGQYRFFFLGRNASVTIFRPKSVAQYVALYEQFIAKSCEY